MEIISELTHYTTVVLGKQSSENLVQKVEVIPIDMNNIVAIIVTDKGHVEHKNIYIHEKVDPNEEIELGEPFIEGDTFVRPLISAVYSINGNINGDWSIRLPNENKDIDDVLEWVIVDNNLQVTWTSMVSGSYIIRYGDLEKTIIVESLF